MADYDPDRPETLATLLWERVHDYWLEYLRYWGLDDGAQSAEDAPDRAVHRSLDSIGAAMYSSISSLQPSASTRDALSSLFESMDLEPPGAGAAKFIRALRKSPVVRDRLSIQLAFEAVNTPIRNAPARAAELVALIGDRRLSERALDYLNRATRLHLWGFESECVIMCRSVLEAALFSRLYREETADRRSPPLEAMLRAAGERGLLPGYAAANTRRGWQPVANTLLADAESIRVAGNNVVHDFPLAGTPARDAESMLSVLARVLDHLYPSDG